MLEKQTDNSNYFWQPKVLGYQILDRRSEMKISQAVLAEKSGINKGYLSKIERGLLKHPPKPRILKRIANSLNLNNCEYRKMLWLAGRLGNWDCYGNLLNKYQDKIASVLDAMDKSEDLSEKIFSLAKAG